MHFAVTRRGSVQAMATATVLDFAGTTFTSQPAPEAFSTAADWLETCDEPVDREHRIFSAGDAYGELHNSQTAAGAGGLRLWRTVMTTAPERCVECDAAWNNHQGIALAKNRLVLLQVSYPGDLQMSVDESRSPFPELLDLAAGLAANGSVHPDDAAEETAARAFGPTGVGRIQLGMSMRDLEMTGLVRGELESCLSFDATNLAGPNNGYASRDKGVVMIVGDRSSRTPEGIGYDSTRAEVEAEYGRLQPNAYEIESLAGVPGYSGTSYSFGFNRSGRVSEMLLLRDDQDCVG
jgi:hypothetical protein